jgi:hypothetical protein
LVCLRLAWASRMQSRRSKVGSIPSSIPVPNTRTFLQSPVELLHTCTASPCWNPALQSPFIPVLQSCSKTGHCRHCQWKRNDVVWLHPTLGSRVQRRLCGWRERTFDRMRMSHCHMSQSKNCSAANQSWRI